MLQCRRSLPVAVAAMLVLAGCGTTAPTPVATATTAAPRVAGLFAITTRTEGNIVIDGRGYALYRSVDDSSSPPRSACTGPCADQWPPASWAPDLRLEGINRELVGTYRRPDGRLQLTLGGWPLYEYAGDRTPGETNGRGRDGRWWLARPDGSL
ncbi:COG4315 family predicted lipoprotein [Micromonospora sp. CA-249363]|uniref:COG4315 family predicted lipoprotein n=1 Tax=Micromonospora sp. CA-249363 TaxID=3239963 RepID=UPI003D934184